MASKMMMKWWVRTLWTVSLLTHLHTQHTSKVQTQWGLKFISIIIINWVPVSQKQCISVAVTNQLLLCRKVIGGITVRITQSTQIHCVCVCVCVCMYLHVHACRHRMKSFLNFHSCTVHLDAIKSFIYPTDAQFDCSKGVLKLTLKFILTFRHRASCL